ncbi:MAG: hypothetical protein LBC82_08945 [Oscillospiraceae bacterium]|jgi:hypothetical protein|nr:hypothetical protein [Oscillospiraceae bacterium]
MIVNTDYYYNSGFENKGDTQGLERALARAERLIDLVTSGKCRELDSLPEAAQEQLKYAVCAQAEWYVIYGYGNPDDTIDCKVRLGDFSYESRNNGVTKSLSPVAEGTLKLSGLLYSGTEVK